MRLFDFSLKAFVSTFSTIPRKVKMINKNQSFMPSLWGGFFLFLNYCGVSMETNMHALNT